MADRSAEPWYATAAYLYVLHGWPGAGMGVPAPSSRLSARLAAPSSPTGCRRALGAAPAGRSRSGCAGRAPGRFPDHDAVVQLYPDADPPPDALCFEFWKLPGHKHLIHDGKRLALVARWPGCCLRFVLARAWPMAWLTSMPSGPAPRLANAMRPGEQVNKIAVAAGAVPAATVRPRPPLSALLELHTLQALDATGGCVIAGGGRRAVWCGCRYRRLARRQRFARPRAAAGAPGQWADARRLSPSGATSPFRRMRGTFRIPCRTSLSKNPKFLETASIRSRCVAGLDGGTSHATRSLTACRRSRCHTRTTPTLSHQRRSRRLPAPVTAHAGETARHRWWPEVSQVRSPRHVRRGRP